MKVDMLEIKKERLEEVRKQLKRYLTGQYNCAAAKLHIRNEMKFHKL